MIFHNVLGVKASALTSQAAWLDRRMPCLSWEIDGFPAFCSLWNRKDMGFPTHVSGVQATVLPVPGLAGHMTPVQGMGLASW